MRVRIKWELSLWTSLFLLAWIIVFGLLTFFVVRDSYEQFRLDAEGVETRGYVTDRRITSGDESDTYTLAYRYDIGFGDPPNWSEDSQDVSSDFYRDHLIEDEVSVSFIRDAPHISRVQNNIWGRMGNIILILVFVGIDAVLIWVIMPRIRIEKS